MILSDSEFASLKKMLYVGAGIHLTDEKKALVTGRLAKRIRILGLDSYGEYFRRLEASPREGGEWQMALDLLTTNETSFFREPKHFQFLGASLLATLPPGQGFRVWSAACSSGEEPYSLAMVLADRRGEAWEMVASDLSTRVLEHARRGIYGQERASQIPGYYLKKFCLDRKSVV
jgi:chemotaxis protein methyltransferase CheR